MPRLLFEKNGRAAWISHLDLMRLFQRAFKRAGLPLTHTQGFNPRPSVSIALPLSVGVESTCELLDFDLEGEMVSCDEITERLNRALVSGVSVLKTYNNGRKLKELSLVSCQIIMEYDYGVPETAMERIRTILSQESLMVDKRSKNGITQQDIIPMIRHLELHQTDNKTIKIDAVICCQNPTLNPMQIVVAIEKYLPDLKPSFSKIYRKEIFDSQEKIFR